MSAARPVRLRYSRPWFPVNPVYVYADIDEDTLLKFNELVDSKKLENTNGGKTPVDLQLADETNFPHQGYIESFDNRLDPNTGSILLRAVFANDDDRIVPGLFARIRIPLSERHPALLVDERAIGTDQANKFVLTLTPTNTVQYQAVELGPLVDGKRIVRSGLAVGEKIIVNMASSPCPSGNAGDAERRRNFAHGARRWQHSRSPLAR